jgi:glycosyltransferase involved in cell wall biosynthesis
LIIGIDASRALNAQVTGTERYSLEIIRHLLALPTAKNHQWRLYTPGAPSPTLFAAATGVEVDVQVLPAARLWTHRMLAWEVLRHPPDVLFIPAHVIPLLPPPLLPPSVVTIHDLGYRYFPTTHPRGQRLYLDWSTRWSATVAAKIIVVSQATAQDLTHFYGINPQKIQVIYEATSKTTVDSRERANTTSTARSYALTLGTIHPRKNLARLIDAFATLIERHNIDWDLVLAGKRGWLSDQLYASAARRGIEERVHFPGYVSEAKADDLLRGARFFAFPSLFEGFGLPVLEAQQMGVPVMCANNSALPEVAGDAALLVDPTDVEAIADAMLRLSRDEGLRQQLIAAGYENIKRFSWEKAARETLAVLESAQNKE